MPIYRSVSTSSTKRKHDLCISYLYNIEPVGVGTASCESLIGYITRLAERHCVPVGILMESQVAPLINKVYGGGNLHRIYEATAAFNGTGFMSLNLVDAVEKLTQQHKLKFLTLLPWAELLPTRGLVSQHRKWCPVCFEEWYKSGEIVYEPLSWSLKSVGVCLKHQQPLEQVCPHCHCINLPLAWKSRLGYCYKCLQWLGSSSINEPISILKSKLVWELWIVETIGELIAAAPSLHLPLNKQQVAQSLKNYINITTGGNIAEFSRQIQMPRNTVWLWCEGRNQPQLEALLRLCYCLNISLLSLLTQETNENQIALLQPPIITKATSRAKAKQLDLLRLEGILEDTLLRHECPPPSMEEVAKRLKLDRRTILRHFPEMCRAISAKYTSYRKAAKLSAIEQCRQEVRQTVVNLYSQNIYPSESRVSKLLTKPGFLRYKEVREVIDQTKEELSKHSSI